MHSDTYKLLKSHCDRLRAQMSDLLPSSTVLASLLNMANAENLLAAHDAASEPPPSGWAHVHEVDNAGVTGIVTAIPGGLRVEWLDADVPDSAIEPAWRIRDIYAISRVDWITKEQYMAHADMTRSMVAKRAKERLRERTMPEGYTLVMRDESYPSRFAVQRALDGLVVGYFDRFPEAMEQAWEMAGDPDVDWCWQPPIDPVEPYTGSLHIPF